MPQISICLEQPLYDFVKERQLKFSNLLRRAIEQVREAEINPSTIEGERRKREMFQRLAELQRDFLEANGLTESFLKHREGVQNGR